MSENESELPGEQLTDVSELEEITFEEAETDEEYERALVTQLDELASTAMADGQHALDVARILHDYGEEMKLVYVQEIGRREALSNGE